MNRLCHFLFPAAVLAVSVSCSESIDLEVQRDRTTYMSVEAILTNAENTYQVIRLKESVKYFSGGRTKECPGVTGAVVEVSDGDSTFLFSEIPYSQTGDYYSPYGFHTVEGKTYTLRIRRVVDGMTKTWTASSTMPPNGFIVDAVDYKDSESMQDSTVVIGVWGQDLPQHSNILALTALNGHIRPMDKSFGLEDKYYNGQYLDGYPVTILTQTWERYNAGELYAKPLEEGDVLTLYAYSLNDDFYDFYMSFYYNMQASAIPLIATQPANVVTNIGGDDVLGYFTTAPVQMASCVVDDPHRTEFRHTSGNSEQ